MELKVQELFEKDLNQNQATEEEKKLSYYYKKNSILLNMAESFLEMKKNGIKYADRNKIKELIRIMTELQTEDKLNMAHKFPYIACELLINADKKIQDMIFLSEEDFNNYNSEKENMNKENVILIILKDLIEVILSLN